MEANVVIYWYIVYIFWFFFSFVSFFISMDYWNHNYHYGILSKVVTVISFVSALTFANLILKLILNI